MSAYRTTHIATGSCTVGAGNTITTVWDKQPTGILVDMYHTAVAANITGLTITDASGKDILNGVATGAHTAATLYTQNAIGGTTVAGGLTVAITGGTATNTFTITLGIQA